MILAILLFITCFLILFGSSLLFCLIFRVAEASLKNYKIKNLNWWKFVLYAFGKEYPEDYIYLDDSHIKYQD